MKNVLALLAIMVTSWNPALGDTMVTCNAKRIVIKGAEFIDLTVRTGANPTNTMVGWRAAPNAGVIIFCREDELTIAVKAEQPVQMLLTPQNGAAIEK